ncbi:1178_t:CDS:2, partial [Racocetra fulgida]
DSVSPTQSTPSGKLWDKLLSAASSAYSSLEDNSDNGICFSDFQKSEKDDWEGETHISRILREYHQQKNGDIPDWLYDSKPTLSERETTKNPISSHKNNPPINRHPTESYKNPLPNNLRPFPSNDNNRGRQPRVYDKADDLLVPGPPASSMNLMNRSHNVNNPSNRFNNYDDQRKFGPPPVPSVPKKHDPRMYNDRTPNNYDPRFYNDRPQSNYDPRMHNDRYNNNRYNNNRNNDRYNDRYNDRIKNDRVPPFPPQQPRVFPPSDVAKLTSKKSQQLLRINPSEYYSNANRARSVSPNPSFRDRGSKQSNQKLKPGVYF